MGSYALALNTTASNNTAVGYQAGYTNVGGVSNTFIGGGAGYTSNPTAGTGYNTCVGYFAGRALTTGVGNTFLGSFQSGGTAGAGSSVTSGSKNVIIGGYVGAAAPISATGSNFIVLSDGDGNVRGTFDSSGNFLVGTTATSNISKLTTYHAGNAFITANTNTSNLTTPAMQVSKGDNNTTTSNVLVQFLVNGFVTGSGQINANGSSAAAFGSFSDQRLKENIVDLPSQLDKIMALRPVEFDYVESMGGGHQIGFIAQEVQTVYPDLVGVGENEMLTLTDMNKNDARLIKCIQEQQALIQSLTARITALEST